MKLNYNDGGRAEAGYKGEVGDCVVRAIATALQKPYKEVYEELHQRGKDFGATKRCRVAKALKKDASPRNGVWREVYEPYLIENGWSWVPTMKIGSGCKVHLSKNELPSGRLIVRVSKHVTCVIDGELHDTYDCSREGTRCVYGYFKKD